MQTTISAYIFFDFHCTGFVCLGCRKWQSWNLFGLFFAARRYITMSKYYFLQGTHWQSTHYAMQCFPKRPSLSNGLCSNCSKIPQTVYIYNKCAIHLLCIVQCSVMNIHSFLQLPSLSNGFCCYVNNRFYNLFCCQCVDFKIRILCRNWHCCIFRLTVTLSQATELCHPTHNRRPVTQPTVITRSYVAT